MARALDRSSSRGRHVESRLRHDLIAWLTTVRPSGQPDTVPIWFLWHDNGILIYSRPATTKLRNLSNNPRVSLVLDNTNNGADVIRIEGTARIADTHAPANEVPAYLKKYGERIRATGFVSADAFARSYSVPIIVSPTKIRT